MLRHDAGGDADADISNFMLMLKHIQKDGGVELINIQSAIINSTNEHQKAKEVNDDDGAMEFVLAKSKHEYLEACRREEASEKELIEKVKHESLASVPTECGMLEQLVIFDMDFNSLSGEIPEELYDLEALHQLDLNDNDLTGTL